MIDLLIDWTLGLLPLSIQARQHHSHITDTVYKMLTSLMLPPQATDSKYKINSRSDNIALQINSYSGIKFLYIETSIILPNKVKRF